MSRADAATESENVRAIVRALDLVPHPEGGYFREIYRSGAEPMTTKGKTDPALTIETERRADQEDQGHRNLLTSIYWMLTKKNCSGWWIINGSDHVHYHHSGATLLYYVVYPDGKFETHRLGQNLVAGDKPQLVVPGGAMKSCRVLFSPEGCDYALIGEAVAPGFDFRDLTVVSEDQLKRSSPEAFEIARDLVHGSTTWETDDYYHGSQT